MTTFERELIAAIPEILRYAERRYPSPNAAEDAVQETLIYACSATVTNTRLGPIGGHWASRTLSHAMIDHWRVEGLHRKRGEAWGNVVSPVATEDPHAVLEYSQALAAVRGATS